MWNDQEPVKRIAEELGCTPSHVNRIAKRLNLPNAYKRASSGGMGDMFDSYIIQYHKEEMPILKQADKIGVSADFIKNRRRILGLSVPAPKRQVKNEYQ